MPRASTVDTELRWTLLHGAGRARAPPASDEIEAELDRDPTAAGQRARRHRAGAAADAGAKAEAWRLATEDDELPNAINEAIIGGFSHPAQTALTRAYREPYFEVIADVWTRRTSEMAQNVVVGLFPDEARRPRSSRRAEAFLAGPDVPPALRRLVAEGRDDALRALRGRARDAQP